MRIFVLTALVLLNMAGFATRHAAASPVTLAWQNSMQIATGRGERGPWQQNASHYDYVDDPTVALDEHGEAAVAWVEQGRKDVFFQRIAYGGKQLGPPVNVSRSPATFSWLPRIALAPGAPQHVFILWQEIIFSGGSHGGDILFARSLDGGKTFSVPINLSNSVGGDGKGRINREIWHNGSYDLAADTDGALYAVWTEYDGPLWFSRSLDEGASFSKPRQITGAHNAKPARAPSLAVGPDRTLYLAWTTGEDAGADIKLAKSTDGGATFDTPRIVAPSKAYSDAPKLAVDHAGVLHLAYAESTGGPFERYQIRYTQSTNGARSFDAPREISTPPLSPGASASFPALGMDGKGGIYVLWELFTNHGQRPHGLGMSISQDGGRSFSAPILVPESADTGHGSNGSHQGFLMKKLSVNSTGAVAVVNSSLKQDAYSRVWLMRAQNKSR